MQGSLPWPGHPASVTRYYPRVLVQAVTLANFAQFIHHTVVHAMGGGVFFSTLVPGSGSLQLPDLAGFGYGLRLWFWVVLSIIVSLTLTQTLITTLTVILP